MIPIINFMIQMERHPDRTAHQVEVLAQYKRLQKEDDGKRSWFSAITTAVGTHVIRIFDSRHSHGRMTHEEI